MFNNGISSIKTNSIFFNTNKVETNIKVVKLTTQ